MATGAHKSLHSEIFRLTDDSEQSAYTIVKGEPYKKGSENLGSTDDSQKTNSTDDSQKSHFVKVSGESGKDCNRIQLADDSKTSVPREFFYPAKKIASPWCFYSAKTIASQSSADPHDPPDKQSVRWWKKKVVITLLSVALVVSVVVAFWISFGLLTPDTDIPVKPVVYRGKLEEKLNLNLYGPSSIAEYDNINMTLPGGGIYIIEKKDQLKRSAREWSVVLHTSKEGDTTVYVTGPTVDCESDGLYNISFNKEHSVLYTISFNVVIETVIEITGTIQRSSSNDKDFECHGKTGCKSSNIVIYKNDNSTTLLEDMETELKTTYNKKEGYHHELTGKTRNSDLQCRFDIETPSLGSNNVTISECNNFHCRNGGSCIVPKGGTDYLCICPSGYTGRNCTTDIDECLSNPCRNKGTCKDGINGYKCECPPGFTHIHCLLNINECQNAPCSNGGTCIDGVDSFHCTCAEGFNGILCENNIDECSSSPCMNAATCVDSTNQYVCQCRFGYDGIHCQTEINECEKSPCAHGICLDEIGRYRCTCDAGYTGSTCNIEIRACSSHPCQNGASCQNQLGGFVCECKTGFEGTLCQNDIDYCADSTCLNGGNCLDGSIGYTCTCAAGYEGSTCSVGQLGYQCTEKTSCVENAACVDGKCVCQGPNVKTSDGVYCRYGCNATCNGIEKDLYSIAGDVCGSTFKRCANKRIYIANCNSADVFNPHECVCIPRIGASWCASNAPDSSATEACQTSCTSYKNP